MMHGEGGKSVFVLAQVTHCFHLLNQLHTPPVNENLKKQQTNKQNHFFSRRPTIAEVN